MNSKCTKLRLAIDFVLTLGTISGHVIDLEFTEPDSIEIKRIDERIASKSGKEAADVYIYSRWSMFNCQSSHSVA